MLDLSTQLKYYKREDIQKAIIACALEKEISIRFANKGFGKRPDLLKYPSEVIDLAKKGASSFHCSEERWHRILDLSPEMSRGELNSNRKAWDLVLDIDCPYWELSKIITWLFIEVLQDHGVKNISVKFSGNKGFHIGVPFEAFPEIWQGAPLSSFFPEAPRAIALYLLHCIEKNYISVDNNTVVFSKRKPNSFSVKELANMTNFPLSQLTKRVCAECHRQLKEESNVVKQTFDFLCAKCRNEELGEDNLELYRQCKKCNSFMERKERAAKNKKHCVCGSNSSYHLFDPSSIVEVDTVLLASRHMYRMPYSLHEKTSLVSMPITLDEVLDFDKTRAQAATFTISDASFLLHEHVDSNEGRVLLEKAFSFIEEEKQRQLLEEESQKAFQSSKKVFSKPESALPEELFPPCIKLILAGLKAK